MERRIPLSEETYEALKRQAEREAMASDQYADAVLRRWLKVDAYPELEWRSGPGGWRVGIRGSGIDVYTIVGYRRVGYSPDEIADELLPRLTRQQVDVALRYYAEHPEEIDEILAESEDEAVKQQLLRSLGPAAYERLTGYSVSDSNGGNQGSK